ncbi:MAG: 23S rRNA (adenine(2503)-C(2))-methyltransferase RlmN [Crocinitomicaceae bacterium]|jgi:23S rRNA (adenine2503-C2)-methyltransferase|nr:23S rRNA (adenine(2503)-C(2))-methyltransferase RlmN [Crocinitomicaceae bacterium]MDA9168983.1 23S rRNA (adenine(2503)-C(2))-methyltransferase RlmN [Crocinitomicaceae bacterium]MDA9882073.1 23S rRNA (adenine(2503)-C(2))-methyltransferase RlmN [Crocinitomicaceae bacterium]MDB2479357.1 23S rRNA (adenine(2503)-C(2))-methyltransferase RlmN [Crocinitomicaceae bacterium]MDG1035938.1 23S rRNA (adenine(2503)-C(2))-methyltransferase RlmN [Crocinitomicaceae bacterium]
MEEKQSIRKLTIEELKGVMVRFSEKPFRAKQLFEWLWQKDAASFEEMSSLPKALREQLEGHYYIDHIELKDQQVSSDKTIKCAFNTQQGNIIEGVLIPTSKRMTACISSQIGCSLACKFCATGKLKLMRNLSAGEMVDQVTYLRDQAQLKYGSTLSNIVYMGMGEPLLNYNNMIQSTNLITSEQGLGISPKRITVSTAGIAKMIKRLGDDEVKFNLALSLHAANDKKRSHIMEINDSNNLDALREALKYFHEKTDTRVTFEYIIFKDFNDALEDAQELAEFAKCVPCKINIIEYNPIDDGEFQQAASSKVDAFANYLEKKNIIVNVRRSRGKDIDAACGQLANKNKAIKKEDRILKA